MTDEDKKDVKLKGVGSGPPEGWQEFSMFGEMKAHNKAERIYLQVYEIAQKYKIDPFQLISVFIKEAEVTTMFLNLRCKVGKEKFKEFIKELFNIGDLPCSDEDAAFYDERLTSFDKILSKEKELEK